MRDLSGDSFDTARTLRLLAAPPGQFSSIRSRLHSANANTVMYITLDLACFQVR